MARHCIAALCLLTFLSGGVTSADNQLEKPFRLEADGKVIDTGAAWGHSSPCVEDVDADGLNDLVLGDFGGKFRVYKNVGTAAAPIYEDAGNLQADGQDASVRIYCCIGSQARFCDLNNDGIRDFISNSYDPGHCYFFRGLGQQKFAASQELVDEAGIPVRSMPDQQQNYQSFGSFFAPVDWDADGDLDLLIGCFDGHLKLRVNQGDATNALFAAENETVDSDHEPLKVSAHCCPVVADWDHDGLWDVLAGSDDGSVTWFRNVGTKQAPRLAKGITLVEKHDGNGYNLVRWSDEEVVPGIRAQIDVVDYNNDGKLDLLLGDFCTVYDVKQLDETKRKEFDQLLAGFEASGKPFAEKMEAIRKDFAERYKGDMAYTDEARAEWSKLYTELREGPEAKQMEEQEAQLVRQIRPYLARTHGDGDRSFDLAVPHGHVWVFIRK